MDSFAQSQRFKVGFVFTLILAIVLFLASGTLGYLYWHKLDDRNKLDASKQQVEESLAKAQGDLTAANKQIGDLTVASDSSGQSISSLQKQAANYKTGMAKITAYKEFLKYYNSVIETHNGYTGWTDAEFQTGKTKAEATGDASFVSTVNWAWYETGVDVATRIIRVNREIVSGIESGIK